MRSCIPFSIVFFFLTISSTANTYIETASITKSGDRFGIQFRGKPYFVKGAVGWSFLEELAASGANSIRTSPRNLDLAHSLGLSVLVNLPMAPERNGFDYSDTAAVRIQFERIKSTVIEYKDHPAVLMWAIGNELDHIPGDLDYNLEVWDAVNDIARMIKEVAPGHLALTVTGFGKLEKLKDIKERCPDLDLLGVNAYASIVNIPGWLREYDWNKPYLVTEWGPSGWWEVPRTRHGVVIEETSSEKAQVYRDRYEKVILADPMCVGSYVFLWTSNRQERTHTWFNMFHNDLKTQTVETMQYMWTGAWPENRSPRVISLQINGLNAIDNIELTPGSSHSAVVVTSDPDHDSLQYEWELLLEPERFAAYAGQGETKPDAASGFIISAQDGRLEFTVPENAGRSYRLFVYIYDGKGNVANANIPFFITR